MAVKRLAASCERTRQGLTSRRTHRLVTRRQVFLNPRATARKGHRGVPQTLECVPALRISQGQLIGLYNPAGRLFLQTESRGVPESIHFCLEEEDQATGELLLRQSKDAVSFSPVLFHPPNSCQQHPLHPKHQLQWRQSSTKRCIFDTASRGCIPPTGLIAEYVKLFGNAGRMECSRCNHFAVCFSCHLSSDSVPPSDASNADTHDWCDALEDKVEWGTHDALVQNRESVDSRQKQKDQTADSGFGTCCPDTSPASFTQIIALVAIGTSFITTIDWRGFATDDMVTSSAFLMPELI